MTKNKTGHATGLAAENFAALILQLKGYRILARRYKTPVGEIDLVARRGGQLCFVEVKARARLEEALAAVTPAMRERIIRAAHYYMAQNPQAARLGLRFDLMAVKPPFRWRHLDNAWRPAA